MIKFEDLGLNASLLTALREEGYEYPTPIQEKAIPFALQGRDLIACAQTGTGKTAAFSIPIIQVLSDRKVQHRGIRCLILTPTRELALQIQESVEAYGRHENLKSTVIFGGVSQGNQVNKIKSGVDVLVATPGRLLDLIQQGFIKLNQIEVLVLDEADRMLDMGFVHDVKKVISLVPSKRQTLFFSATMPKEIVHLANSILTNPEKIEVSPVSSTAETIKQELYYVDKGNKIWLLIQLIEELNLESVLVFSRTKHGCDRIVRQLEKSKIKGAAIHGNKSQNARQNALAKFKDKSIKVLVATDIAARGIDIDELKYVINYDLPNVPETYVHRIGRTGRAGNNGTAISFCNIDEKPYVKDIEKLIKISIPVIENHSFPMMDFTETDELKQQGRNKRFTKKPEGPKKQARKKFFNKKPGA